MTANCLPYVTGMPLPVHEEQVIDNAKVSDHHAVIPTEEIERLMPEVRDYEPRLALDGESDGLKFYQQICSQAGQHLFKGGCLIMEIGADQGEAVSRMMTHQGFEQVEVRKDLAGLDRLVTGYYGID